MRGQRGREQRAPWRQQALGWTTQRGCGFAASASAEGAEAPAPAQRTNAAKMGFSVLERRGYTPDKLARGKAEFAVVAVGPHQFKVSPDDVIVTEKVRVAGPRGAPLRRRVAPRRPERVRQRLRPARSGC